MPVFALLLSSHNFHRFHRHNHPITHHTPAIKKPECFQIHEMTAVIFTRYFLAHRLSAGDRERCFCRGVGWLWGGFDLQSIAPLCRPPWAGQGGLYYPIASACHDPAPVWVSGCARLRVGLCGKIAALDPYQGGGDASFIVDYLTTFPCDNRRG